MREEPDETEYQRLVEALGEAGIECFDRESIKAGAPLAAQLLEGIRKCGSCVFLATEKSVNSPWCLSELGAFWHAGRRIVAYLPDATFGKAKLPSLLDGQVAATEMTKLIVALKGDALRGAADHSRILVFVTGDSQDAGKRDSIRQAIEQLPLSGSMNRFKTIHNLSQLDDDQLGDWTGLFLGMPYRQTFTPTVVARIVEWVRAGARLVMCGFELGERHHLTNLNQLSYHFGVQFNSDAVVHPRPSGPLKPDDEWFEKRGADGPRAKDYDKSLCFKTFDTLSEEARETYVYASSEVEVTGLLQGVRTIRMRNVCSLHLEPGARPIVLATPNRVRSLTIESGRYSSPPGFQLASGTQGFEEPLVDRQRAVVALAPKGLTLDGWVLALGSWDFRSAEPCDNEVFLQNLWRWLRNDIKELRQ
jgi:hypothetical protein